VDPNHFQIPRAREACVLQTTSPSTKVSHDAVAAELLRKLRGRGHGR
jgi:hypothetical protein